MKTFTKIYLCGGQMRKNMKIFFVIFLAIPFLLFKGKELNGNEAMEKVKIIRNAKDPIYGEFKFELVEDITIGEGIKESSLIVDPWKWKAKIDGKGNIYILDSKECKVLKWDKKGNFIQSMGRRGEGPGEFSRPGPWFVGEDQTVWVYDSIGQKLTKFGSSGELIKQIKINKHLWDFYIDREERIFGLMSEWNEQTSVVSFARFSREGKMEKKLIELPEKLSTHFLSRGVVTFSHPYLFNSFFSPFVKDAFLFGNSEEYKLIVIDNEGKKTAIIEKKEDKVPISRDIKNEVLSWFNISQELKGKIMFAPYIPFFDDILTDNEGRIYIRRLPSSPKEFKFSYFDIFDKKGRFIYKTSFPFEPSVIKDGFIINLRFAEEKEKYILTRYRVKNWKDLK
jgi:hypothetical protein